MFLFNCMLIYTFFSKIIKDVIQYITNMLYITTRQSMPFYIYKVIIYDNVSNENIDVTQQFYEGKDYFRNIPFENSRIEYRYTWLGSKYRHVSKDGNFTNMSSLFCKEMFCKKYIQAELIYKLDDNSEDVITKVKKYAGPKHNFYNMKIHPTWMFPSYDDMTDFTMELTDSHGFLKSIDMKNDQLYQL